MRAALGVLFLVLLFVAATLVQERWINGVRDRLPGLQIQPVQASEPVEQTPDESGWARLVIGRPSGADPVDLPHAVRELDSPRQMISGMDPELTYYEEEEASVPSTSDYEITLDSGSTLSEVCVRFYGSGAPKLYNALAKYNGFDDANAIPVGHKLKIPPTRELLFAARETE